MNRDQLVERLEAVRDRLATRGWAQEVFRDQAGQCCIRGAIRLTVAGGSRIDADVCVIPDRDVVAVSELEDFVNHAVAEILGEGTAGVTVYHDHAAGRYLVGDDGSGQPHALTEATAYYNDYVLKDQAQALEFMDKLIIRAQEKA